MDNRKKFFLHLGNTIRRLPSIRGKVRIGLYFYKKLNFSKESFVVESTLLREKLTFQLNLNCAHERMCYLMGHYEDEGVSLLAELYEGGTILDVGANIGLISLPLAVRTRDKALTLPHVYSVEALRGNYMSLCKNVELNDLNKFVRPIEMALGSNDKMVRIEIEGNDPMKTGTANILPDERNFHGYPIHIKSIDEAIHEGNFPQNISLMKIDTDGYDFEVLRGAKELLIDNRPIIFAELAEYCLNWHGYGIKSVVSFLEKVGYETWPMLKEPSMKFKKYAGPDDYQMNCLLVPQELSSNYQKFLA